MIVRNDNRKEVKEIAIGDVVIASYKAIRNGKTMYRSAEAPLTRIGAVSFWVLNPFTEKEEAVNINTFYKKNFFSKDAKKWQAVQKHNAVNMDYV